MPSDTHDAPDRRPARVPPPPSEPSPPRSPAGVGRTPRPCTCQDRRVARHHRAPTRRRPRRAPRPPSTPHHPSSSGPAGSADVSGFASRRHARMASASRSRSSARTASSPAHRRRQHVRRERSPRSRTGPDPDGRACRAAVGASRHAHPPGRAEVGVGDEPVDGRRVAAPEQARAVRPPISSRIAVVVTEHVDASQRRRSPSSIRSSRHRGGRTSSTSAIRPRVRPSAWRPRRPRAAARA